MCWVNIQRIYLLGVTIRPITGIMFSYFQFVFYNFVSFGS